MEIRKDKFTCNICDFKTESKAYAIQHANSKDHTLTWMPALHINNITQKGDQDG